MAHDFRRLAQGLQRKSGRRVLPCKPKQESLDRFRLCLNRFAHAQRRGDFQPDGRFAQRRQQRPEDLPVPRTSRPCLQQRLQPPLRLEVDRRSRKRLRQPSPLHRRPSPPQEKRTKRRRFRQQFGHGLNADFHRVSSITVMPTAGPSSPKRPPWLGVLFQWIGLRWTSRFSSLTTIRETECLISRFTPS